MQPEKKNQLEYFDVFCRQRLESFEGSSVAFNRVYSAYTETCNVRNEIPLEKNEFFDRLSEWVSRGFLGKVLRVNLETKPDEREFVFVFINLSLREPPGLEAYNYVLQLFEEKAKTEGLTPEEEKSYERFKTLRHKFVHRDLN